MSGRDCRSVPQAELEDRGEVRLPSGRDLVSKGNCPARRHRTKSIEERAHPCMRRQPIVLSQGSACRDRDWSPSRGDDPDRAKSLYDDWFAFSISALHPIAARLVVGPDDIRDVGMGNERYDAVRPSDRGVYSQVNGGHSNSPFASRGRNKPFVRHRGREVDRSQGRAHPPASRANLRVRGIPDLPFHAKVVTLNL